MIAARNSQNLAGRIFHLLRDMGLLLGTVYHIPLPPIGQEGLVYRG